MGKETLKGFEIAGLVVRPGESKITSVPVGRLYDFTEMSIPIHVQCGKKSGPTFFVSGAIHGDEIIGTEIIRRLLCHKSLGGLRGTLVAVPTVNVYGFNRLSRYLPDRRDLNRCFPGRADGSLASRMAHMFFSEVASRCDYGIDFHSGAIHRTNLPQVRAYLKDPRVKKLARAFNAPVILNSSLRDGSLRQSLVDKKIPILLFEGGEALRFDEATIQLAVRGALNVMRSVGMLPKLKLTSKKSKPTFIANSSSWVRASQSGSARVLKELGERVKKGEVLAVISDPFGRHRVEVLAEKTGIIIGQNNLPQVSQGDALFHVATFDNSRSVVSVLEDEDLVYSDH